VQVLEDHDERVSCGEPADQVRDGFEELSGGRSTGRWLPKLGEKLRQLTSPG
jgi:hypothetical protein